MIQEIKALTPADLPCIRNDDNVEWTSTATDVYSSRSAWEALRFSRPVVNWYGLVWLKRYILRCAAIQWMACHRKLGTKDRLDTCFMGSNSTFCVLCEDAVEIHHHLFLECPFWVDMAGVSEPTWGFEEACRF